MNRSFENIFKKYNITCSIPRKHPKASKTSKQIFAIHRNTQNLPRNSSVVSKKNKSFGENVLENNKAASATNSSFCYNTKTLDKYKFIPRYNTLDLTPVRNVRNRLDCSATKSLCSENIFIGNSGKGKENCLDCDVSPAMEWEKNNLTASGIISETDLNLNKINSCDNTETNNSAAFKRTPNKQNNLSCSFNFGKRKQNCLSRVQSQYLRYNKLNISVVPKKPNDLSLSIKNQENIESLKRNAFDNLDVSIPSSVSSTSQHFEIIDTPTKAPQHNVVNESEELDLLVDLIERDEQNKRKPKRNKSNCDDILPASKSFLKGGYEELFERTLKSETVRGNFLKHDRKYGLRVGKLLTVIKLETSYGFTIAVVRSKDLHKNFAVAVAQEMVPQLKEGTQIDAFFDEKSIPYKLQFDDDYLDVYLEPYKLLVV